MWNGDTISTIFTDGTLFAQISIHPCSTACPLSWVRGRVYPGQATSLSQGFHQCPAWNILTMNISQKQYKPIMRHTIWDRKTERKPHTVSMITHLWFIIHCFNSQFPHILCVWKRFDEPQIWLCFWILYQHSGQAHSVFRKMSYGSNNRVHEKQPLSSFFIFVSVRLVSYHNISPIQSF